MSAYDALQFEALLIARAYVYEAFHHLCGGAPNRALLDGLSSGTARDVFEEYESVDDVMALASVLAEYAGMNAEEKAGFMDAAGDEYTRVFIGPASLPASPYESPYRGSHDTSLLQENTLVVRRAYAAFGLAPKRIHAIPDDHVAFMCSFMEKRAERACELFAECDMEALGTELADELGFVDEHLDVWLDVFAESVATSDAAASNVLYPNVLRALSAFAKADRAFLIEGMAWLQEEPAMGEQEDGNEDTDVSAARDKASSAFEEAISTLDALKKTDQMGLDDYLLVQI